MITAQEYGYISFVVNEKNQFACKSGNYDHEETYTRDYITDYFDTPTDALNAYITGKTNMLTYGY